MHSFKTIPGFVSHLCTKRNCAKSELSYKCNGLNLGFYGSVSSQQNACAVEIGGNCNTRSDTLLFNSLTQQYIMDGLQDSARVI